MQENITEKNTKSKKTKDKEIELTDLNSDGTAKITEEKLEEILDKRSKDAKKMVKNGSTIKNKQKKKTTISEEVEKEETISFKPNKVTELQKIYNRKMTENLNINPMTNLSNTDLKYLQSKGFLKNQDLVELFNKQQTDKNLLSIKKKIVGVKFTEDGFKKFFTSYKDVNRLLNAAKEEDNHTLEIDSLSKDFLLSKLILNEKGVSEQSLNSLTQLEQDTQAFNDFVKTLVTEKQTAYEVPELDKAYDRINKLLMFKDASDLSPEQRKALNYVPYSEEAPEGDKEKAIEIENKLLLRVEASSVLAGPKLNVETFDAIAREMKALYDAYEKADKNSQEAKNYQEIITKSTRAICHKNVNAADVTLACRSYGTDTYERYRDAILQQQNSKVYLARPHNRNIDDFYNRLGKDFDAEHNPTGSELTSQNLESAVQVLRELKGYIYNIGNCFTRVSVNADGTTVETKAKNMGSLAAKSAQLHLDNIKQFLEFKGVPKEMVDELMSCSDKELHGKCEEFMATKQKTHEKKASATLEDGNLKVHITVDIGDKSHEIEEVIPFDDVKKAAEKKKVASSEAKAKGTKSRSQEAKDIQKMMDDYKKKYGKDFNPEDAKAEDLEFDPSQEQAAKDTEKMLDDYDKNPITNVEDELDLAEGTEDFMEGDSIDLGPLNAK